MKITDKIKHLYFDHHINDQLDKHLYLFKYIHPNVITIFGLILNAICFYTLYILKNKQITAILIILRITADNLDGMVARKFNKTSKLGGLLDTMSDAILLGTIVFATSFYFFNNYIISALVGLAMVYVMLTYLFMNNALVTHSNISKQDTILNAIPFLIYHNTYLASLFIIFLMYLI